MGLRPDSQEFSQFLRLAFLRSPNYQAGVSGWTINQDGSAEFNNVTIRNGQIVAGTALYYSSLPPAAGNLVASIASSSGTDSAGNAYIGPGVFTYVNTGSEWNAIGLQNAKVVTYTAATEAGPWTAQSIIEVGPNNPDLTVQGAGNLLLAALTGVITLQSRVNCNIVSNAPLIHLTNGQAAPNQATFLLEADAAGDPAVRIDVNGDNNGRLAIDSTGLIKWGNGTNATDTRLYRAAAGELAADFIAANNGGAAEVWNAPAFANSWANAATGAALQYRFVAAPYNSMQWVGRLLVPAGVAAGQAVITAIAAAYRPAHSQSVVGIDVTTGALVRFQMNPSGVLLYESGSAAGDNIDITDGLVSLDA